jgi:hypothetical protein
MPVPVNSLFLEDDDGLIYRAQPKKAIVDVVLSLDTAGYTAGDVLADTQVVANAFHNIDVGGQLDSVTVIDFDHLTAANDAIDIYIIDDETSIGTENSVPSMSDAAAVKIQTKVSLVAGDFADFTNSRVGSVGNLKRVIRPKAGTKELYVAAVCGVGVAAAVHTASGIMLRLGILQD